MKCAVDQAVARRVTQRIQRLHDLFDDVVAAIVQDVGHVLHQQRQWPKRLHVGQIAQEEISPRVYLKRLGVVSDLPQFCTTDARVGLAWRPADQHVDGVFDGTETKLFSQFIRFDPSHIAGPCVHRGQLGISAMEVDCVRQRRQRLNFKRADIVKACFLETE
ncbi:MAG: hypothetical protein BGP12_17595 [Rhodospirillales bacterium 70-18]|nr:MAG: hypothetical protein BGP12_17595 [Rhodospirillales bacterium 70-18]